MRGRLSAGLLSGLLVLGCGGNSDDEEPAGPHAIYVVPSSWDKLAGGTFFNHPWPSDLRREDDDTIRFAGYPNPRETPIIDIYIESMAHILTGFSPAAPGYVRFTAAIDPSTLPESPLAATDASSSVQLLDIDPSSPEHGTRKPVALQFRKEVGVYYETNTLAFMPALGRPLRPSTRYALIVTDSIRTESGGRMGRSSDLSRVLGLSAASGPTSAARDQLSSAIDDIAGLGIEPKHIIELAIFTTDSPTKQTETLRDWVRFELPRAQRHYRQLGREGSGPERHRRLRS